MTDKTVDERYCKLLHSHGRAYAEYDKAFNNTYKSTKDIELASLRALAAFVAANEKSGAQLLIKDSENKAPEPKVTAKVRQP